MTRRIFKKSPTRRISWDQRSFSFDQHPMFISHLWCACVHVLKISYLTLKRWSKWDEGCGSSFLLISFFKELDRLSNNNAIMMITSSIDLSMLIDTRYSFPFRTERKNKTFSHVCLHACMNTKEVMMTIIGLGKVCKPAIIRWPRRRRRRSV